MEANKTDKVEYRIPTLKPHNKPAIRVSGEQGNNKQANKIWHTSKISGAKIGFWLQKYRRFSLKFKSKIIS